MDGYKLLISRGIAKIENAYPPDNLISTYKDFIKYRDVLPYYKFNINVLNSLVEITCNVWFDKKRIARIPLLRLIRRYSNAYYETLKEYSFKNPVDSLPLKSKCELYKIFISLFENRVLNEEHNTTAQYIFNHIFNKVSLSEYEETWLTANYHLSGMLLNRLLRYPAKSKIISQWVRDNYDNDMYRQRRAELTSWLIDEDINYKVPCQTLIEDFECQNKADIKLIAEYKTDYAAKQFVKEVCKGIFEVDKDRFDYPDYYNRDDFVEKELILAKRFYKMELENDEDAGTTVPNFEKSRAIFHSSIEDTRTRSMLWSIGYTRHNTEIKTELFKRHYCSATKYRIIEICEKLQLLDCLKWMLKEES